MLKRGEMKNNRIRIVLVETSHPGNVGSTARAMKTMGLTRLYLVAPKCELDRRAYDMAAGADDVLQHAHHKETLIEALEGCQLIFATSARLRHMALPECSPKACAEEIVTTPMDTEIALVFGRESSGLSNEELWLCHRHVYIPTVSTFSSLNLSQAVQILAYEIRMHQHAVEAVQMASRVKEVRADAKEVALFHEHLEQVLIQIDFLKLSSPKRLKQRLKRLFSRAALEKTEVNILRGILTHIQHHLRSS